MLYDPEICPEPFTLALVRGHGQSRRHYPFVRYAVRAVTSANGRLLLVHSSVDGDYKFPGGGVQEGEKHPQTLARELLEETGCSLKRIVTLLGVTIEFDFSSKMMRSNFRMISFYYLCELENGSRGLELDPYEKELGFSPEWLPMEDALVNNERLIEQPGSRQPFWLARETAVLRALTLMPCLRIPEE